NIKVHGLTEEMVADKPTLLEIWEEILPRLQGKQVVAHFAKFDMGVLKGSLASWNIPQPEFDFICSWMLAKKALPHLESFGLKSVAESVGFKFQHHHALEDARACATAVAHIMQQCGAQDFEQLAGNYNLELGRMWRGGVRQCTEKPEGEPVMESLF
ncbi:MAG: 3'-5' exoribonuclease, partial [Phascolarctobacterium sp.]|nr:3'-5' exoribonuclease [Phascolarctobacterium sp.]